MIYAVIGIASALVGAALTLVVLAVLRRRRTVRSPIARWLAEHGWPVKGSADEFVLFGHPTMPDGVDEDGEMR